MAKQLGVIQYSGKLGNVVGMKKGAGQNGNNVRIKSDEVKNPKTLAQIIQRMKTKAAANFYRAFKEVLNHSFQGIEYGAPSHNKFMKLAMQENVFLPLLRGSYIPAGNTFTVSTGSLPSIECECESSINQVSFSATASEVSNWGGLSQAIIDTWNLSDGDQITVLALGNANTQTGKNEFADSTEWTANIKRYILDVSSTAALPSDIQFKTTSGGKVVITIEGGQMTEAAAIIVSRPVVDGSKVSWLRSTTKMTLEYTYERNIASWPLINDAIMSFASESGKTVSSDWYLNGGFTSTKGVVSTARAISGGQLAKMADDKLLYICKTGIFIIVDNDGTPTGVYTSTDVTPTTAESPSLTAMSAANVRALGFPLVTLDQVTNYVNASSSDDDDDVPRP